MRPGSIRLRLAAWYFVSLAMILGLFAIGAWIAMKAGVREAVDHDLRVRIRDVREFMDEELAAGPAELLEELKEHSLLGLGGGLLQLSDGDARVIFRSGRLKDARLRLPVPAAGDHEVRFVTEGAGRSSVRAAAQIVDVKGSRFLVQVAEPMDEFDESLQRFEKTLLILAPFFLLLASVGGFWLSGRALAPVDRITKDARLITIANLSARLHVPNADDELQRLAVTLNAMLDRIDAEVRRIVQFTADASHELRAPLTLIQTAAEFSLRRERTSEELLDAMRKILRACGRTSRLVDDLLLLARADSSADELHFEPTDISATGRDASELAVALAEAKNIQVATDIPAKPFIVNGNEQLLARLWLILLDNAVKYTQEGGRIAFSMRARDGRLEASVSDTGIGIAAADLPHVYDRFWRADKVRSRDVRAQDVRSRNSGGAGLGLSIARWIVLRHAGEIEIASEPGRGSLVTVQLPLLPGARILAGQANDRKAPAPA
jgi:heavy metal sensor kinase